MLGIVTWFQPQALRITDFLEQVLYLELRGRAYGLDQDGIEEETWAFVSHSKEEPEATLHSIVWSHTMC